MSTVLTRINGVTLSPLSVAPVPVRLLYGTILYSTVEYDNGVHPKPLSNYGTNNDHDGYRYHRTP